MDLFEVESELAIVEFGTIVSEVAVTLSDEQSRRMTRVWKNRDGSLCEEKVLTCLLLKPDGKTVESFGYEAEKKFEELSEDRKGKDYYYFKGIKGLHYLEENDSKTTMIPDESGKLLPARDIFALMIECLVTGKFDPWIPVKIKEILLVVPAGSTPFFMKLMKEALKQAGLDEKNSTIITSVDSTALLFKSTAENVKSKLMTKFSPGTQFLTVTMDGESVETVIHKWQPSGHINEIGVLKRGMWGIQTILNEFEKLLIGIVGSQVYERFQNEFKEDWMDLMRYVKRKFAIFDFEQFNTQIIMQIPLRLCILCEAINGITIDTAIARSCYHADICTRRDKMVISCDVFKSLFEETVKRVTYHIESVKKHMDFQAIFMTGTFANIKIFQNAFESSFPDVTVFSPTDPEKAVIKGAFIYQQESPSFKGKKRPQVVVAIDFGTTYSGWTRSYRQGFLKDATDALKKDWVSDTGVTPKTPTCILIKKDGKTVDAFGYDAINRYMELIDEGNHESFYFFRYFKMALHKKLGERLDRNLTIEDELGRPLPALDVFAASIQYLRKDCLEHCKDEVAGAFNEDEIQWVITVPAIWSDAAKQFMREAALKAGIKNRRLLLALEPEAASILCRHLPIQANTDNKYLSISTFPIGTKYLVLDAGGGTVDITVHEVLEENKLKEIHSASGGGWGGMMVNNAFERFMKEFLGGDIYTRFCNNETEDHLLLMMNFELKKRKVSSNDETVVKLQTPVSLSSEYRKIAKRPANKDATVMIKKDKMFIPAATFRRFFEESIKNIITHLQLLLKETKVDAILMVGGYSDSPLLQEAVRKSFPGVYVVKPPDAVTAVMRGALIFGHMPRQITDRVLKFTYGVKVMRPFIEGKDPKSKRVKSDSGYECKDVFHKHVTRGESVNFGQPQIERSYRPAFKTQKELEISMYASELENPEYVDENCILIGKMKVELTDHDGDLSRSVKVALTFSNTEIKVHAKDEKTGEETNVFIDFLG